MEWKKFKKTIGLNESREVKLSLRTVGGGIEMYNKTEWKKINKLIKDNKGKTIDASDKSIDILFPSRIESDRFKREMKSKLKGFHPADLEEI